MNYITEKLLKIITSIDANLSQANKDILTVSNNHHKIKFYTL